MKNAIPPGYPAPLGSYGLHYDRTPKAFCEQCARMIEKERLYFCGLMSNGDGTFNSCIKKKSAACELFKKKEKKTETKISDHIGDKENNEKPAYGTKEQDTFKLI